MRYPAALLALLADGEAHDLGELGAALALSPQQIGEELRLLGEFGVRLQGAGGGSCRLASPLRLLTLRSVEAALDPGTRARVAALEVVAVAESTNSTLLARTPPADGRCEVLIAEYQSGGRGRRGRRWVAPLASGILMSVSCRYAQARPDLSGVTLAVGVAILRALARFEVADLKLKWPNDVLHDGAKLAGVLCELKVEAGGPAHVVVGVGLNVALPAGTVAELAAQGRIVTDLTAVRPALDCSLRAALAAALIGELTGALDEFGRTGLASYIDEWRAADALDFRAVTVEAGGAVTEGVACGISADGALLVDVDGRIARIEAGEVSVRTA